MKTKKEIRARIQSMRQELRNYDHLPKQMTKIWQEVGKAQIHALEWALGYKTPQFRYWCTRCNIAHRNPQCPKCGSTRVAPKIERIRNETPL